MRILLILLFVLSFLSLKAQYYFDLSPQECYDLIERYKDSDRFTILDVRTKGEYDPEHLEDAYNRDFYANDFSEQLDSLDKSRVYLLYCRSGNRSGRTLDLVEELKFDTVYNMLGGITRWLQEDYPVTTEVPPYDPSLYASSSSIAMTTDIAYQLYPNPSSGIVYLPAAENQTIDVVIQDQYGNIRPKVVVKKSKIDLTDYQGGIYFISIYKQGRIQKIQKIIKL